MFNKKVIKNQAVQDLIEKIIELTEKNILIWKSPYYGSTEYDAKISGEFSGTFSVIDNSRSTYMGWIGYRIFKSIGLKMNDTQVCIDDSKYVDKLLSAIKQQMNDRYIADIQTITNSLNKL